MISMDNHFFDDEKLYRAVFPASRMPCFWKENGKLSSAALKDPKGLSVERGNYRNDTEVIYSMQKDFTGNIVRLDVKQCREVNAVVVYLPTQRSEYHSEIHGNNTRRILSNTQAHALANQAVLIYKRPENVL